MGIKILPEHEAIVGKSTSKTAQPAISGRIKILPEDQSVLEGKIPAPAPVVATPTQQETPSLFSRAKTAVGKGADFALEQVKQAYERGQVKQPQFKAEVGEGMTPEEKVIAQESIKQGIKSDPIVQAYEDIKLPYMDAGITYNKNKALPLVTDVVKSVIEAPEKAGRTLTEAAGLTKFSDERGTDTTFQTQSYGEKATRLADSFLDKGYSYSTAVLLGAGLTGLEASGDVLFFSSLLRAGAAKATGQTAGKITPDEIKTAHEFLGNPKTLAEAEARWRSLQKQFHPDKNGGNDAISKQLNQAIAVLRKEGIPTEGRFAGWVDRRPTKKQEVKMIGEKPTEAPVPVQAVVPEPAPVSNLTEKAPTLQKPKTDTINIVPENIIETAKKEGLDYDPIKEIKLSTGEVVKRPETIVSRTQLQSLLKTLEKDEITLKIDDNKNLIYTEPGKREITIKSSALGLVTDKLPVGGNVKITRAALGVKGTAKDTVFRGVDDEGGVVAKEFTQPEKVKAAETPAELKHRIEQLNKVAQSQAILRKAGGVKKGHAGEFQRSEMLPKQGQVGLKKDVLLDDRQYMETLAHELGHALENKLTGTTNSMTHKVFGESITSAEWKTIRNELEAVTRRLVGDEVVNAKPAYYLKNTELLARFIEKQFASPGDLYDLAPTAMEFFQKNAYKNPIIQDYMDAVKGTIDKGQKNWSLFFKDMKETYEKELGKKVGGMAWDDEVVLRSMVERSKIEIEDLLNTKFQNVKDDPALLFRSVESIKVTKNGVPEFGTRKFLYTDDLAQAKALEDEGYKIVKDSKGEPVMEIVKGEAKVRVAKDRYTPEQGKAFFDELSPEGKQLVKDFTSAKEEARDYFNRELIKDVHKIEGNIEGWVHHVWDNTGTIFGKKGNTFKLKTAASRKMRTEEEGYIEDFRVAMEKMLKDVNVERVYNEYIGDFLARVSRPYTDGMEIPKGWIVVEGDLRKGGIARLGQNKFKILRQDGGMITGAKSKYIMPDKIYRRYELVKEVAKEAGDVVKIFNSLNRYWKVNILFHPGSTATNAFSGGIQYSSKVMTDFYEELLTGDVAMKKTQSNISSILTTLLPKGWYKDKGWKSSPDWIYGGDMSNNYGQFSTERTPGIKMLDKSVDFYGDKVLKTYGMVERYWKKVIVSAEGGSKLDRLKMGKRGLELPTEEEKQIIARINKEVDLYAYDYDNIPVQLEEWSRSPLGSGVTPFLKYPYKAAKHVTKMAEKVFDRSLPYQERVSGLLTLGTMASLYAYYRSEKREEQQTPEVPESAPASMSTRGRLFVDTDENGNEIFTRVSKYPFVNLTEAGLQFVEGNQAQAWQSVNDMIGSFGPAAEFVLALKGWSTEYNENTPFPVRMGKLAGSYLPGTRILSDVARYFDPYQRVQKTFSQGITSVLPLPANDEEVLKKLRGEIKTVNVPIEGNIEDTNEEGSRRTTITRYVENYKEDILMGLLLGIYQTRINPEEAEAFVIRKEENEAKKNK